MKLKVWTPNGYLVGPTNSMVGKGESIIDYTNGTGTLVTKGKVGVDNQPSSVRQDDSNVIAGNDIDWTNGVKFSLQIAPLTARLLTYNNIEKKMNKKPEMSSLSKQTMQLQKAQLERAKAPILQAMKNITDRQEKLHLIEDYTALFKANCGKDRFADGKNAWDGIQLSFNDWTRAGKGKVSNAALDIGYMAPALLEKQMLNHWMKENPLMPNIYASNRYGQSALLTLNRLRVNPYNQLQALNQNDRSAYYRMLQDGGYTGGLRLAGRVALALGNARNVADVLNNTDLQNNKYRQDWATAALAEGNQDATRRQAANQYAWEAYNRAHGAKIKGIETHLANLGLIGQKWLSQRIKNKQYGDILDMYQLDIDNKNAALKAIYGIGIDKDGNIGSAVSLRLPKTGMNPDAIPGTRSVNKTTLSDSVSSIAPGWTPGGYRFVSPNLQYAMNKAVQNNQKTLAAARNKEAFDRLMYGDYGSGRINFNNTLKGSLYTNKSYLNSLLPFELWAGPDGEFAPMLQYPLTWGDYVS